MGTDKEEKSPFPAEMLSDIGAADPNLLKKFTMTEEDKQALLNGRLLIMGFKEGFRLLKPKVVTCVECEIDSIIISIKRSEDGIHERVEAFTCCCPHCGANV